LVTHEERWAGIAGRTIHFGSEAYKFCQRVIGECVLARFDR
jgi:hypothetical protein